MGQICEWVPEAGDGALRMLTAEEHAAAAKLSVAHQAALEKVHTLLAFHHGGEDKARLDKEGLAEVVLAATDTKAEEGLLDELMAEFGDGGKGVSEESLNRMLTSGRLRPEHRGRYWVALSLAEAETLRRVLHVRCGRGLLDKMNVELALHVSAQGAGAWPAPAPEPCASNPQP